MGMTAGDETVAAGSMARAIYDALNTEFGSESGDLDTDRKRFCGAIAQAVVDYIADNADVRITTSDDALQQASGTDTTAPTADRVLAGAIE